MKMAIAAEVSKHPTNRSNYKVWYLEIDSHGEVIGIGVKSREELVKDVFESYKKTGKSNWRAFCKEAEQSKEIELYDFIAQNMHENTHFGELPTLSDFQETLNQLQLNLELRTLAS